MKMQLMHEEVYYVPRYHWWQGWLEPKRIDFVDDDGEPDGHAWQWKGDRLRNLHVTETHWDSNGIDDWSWEETRFCGWDKLLRPKNRRTRMVPSGDSVDAPEPQWKDGALTFGPVRFPGPGSGASEVAAYDDEGHLLFTATITNPQSCIEGDVVEISGQVSLAREKPQ